MRINQTLPAVSDERAMLDFPDARNAERDALLDMVKLEKGIRVLDVQSSSGYLSQEIYNRLQGNVECVCLEPTDVLRERIPEFFTVVDNPVENFYSLADVSMDLVLGLVGLHHSTAHLQTINECYRVLKPSGSAAFCEVIEGSNIARWLNEFVNQHNPVGHCGFFVKPNAMASMFNEAGFENIVEQVKQVPWKFAKEADIPIFFRGLFGIRCEESLLISAIKEYFHIKNTEAGVEVEWYLSYCSGQKRKTHTERM